jgi:hypothetical protein
MVPQCHIEDLFNELEHQMVFILIFDFWKRATALVADKRIKGVSLTEVRRLVQGIWSRKIFKEISIELGVMMLSLFLKMTLTKL